MSFNKTSIRLSLSLSLAVLLLGCSDPQLPSGAAAPTPTPQPACSSSNLKANWEAAAVAAQGRVGAAAILLEGGDVTAVHGTEHFPMQSVYKLPIGMFVLHQIDLGKLKLDQKVKVEPRDFVTGRQHSPIRDKHPKGVELTVQELLRYMVSESDGSACDVLLKLIGGPDVVTKYLRELGITDMVVANTERELGEDGQAQYRNWATPESAVALLRMVQDGPALPAPSRTLLLDFMTTSPTGPKRIKGLLPAGVQVAHKTGSSGRVDGFTRALNDIGIITLPDGRHLAIAVFVSDSKVEEAKLESIIAQIGRASWDCWTK
jgi:beta-lactamase class A